MARVYEVKYIGTHYIKANSRKEAEKECLRQGYGTREHVISASPMYYYTNNKGQRKSRLA